MKTFIKLLLLFFVIGFSFGQGNDSSLITKSKDTLKTKSSEQVVSQKKAIKATKKQRKSDKRKDVLWLFKHLTFVRNVILKDDNDLIPVKKVVPQSDTKSPKDLAVKTIDD